MAKDPAFLFYPGDWLGGTMTFSRLLKGCYLDLLMCQFHSGHLSIEEIKSVLGGDFDQAWPVINKKFALDQAGKFFNKRLEEEMQKRSGFTASRRKNAAKKKNDMQQHMHKHVQQHTVKRMENENENENINRNESENADAHTMSKDVLFEQLFTDELFLADLSRLHPKKDLQKAFQECFLYHSQKPSPPVAVWEWKQKLSTWLTITHTKNESSKDRQQNRIQSLIAGHAKRYGKDSDEGKHE